MSVQSLCLSLTCHLTTFPLSPVYLSSYVALKGITRGQIKPLTEVKHARSPRLCRTITLTLSANDVICNPSGCCHLTPPTICIVVPRCRPGPGHADAYPGCSSPRRCGPCSRRRRRSANAAGCSALGSDRGTRPPGTPSRSRSSGTGSGRRQSLSPFTEAPRKRTRMFEWIIGYCRLGEECFDERRG